MSRRADPFIRSFTHPEFVRGRNPVEKFLTGAKHRVAMGYESLTRRSPAAKRLSREEFEQKVEGSVNQLRQLFDQLTDSGTVNHGVHRTAELYGDINRRIDNELGFLEDLFAERKIKVGDHLHEFLVEQLRLAPVGLNRAIKLIDQSPDDQKFGHLYSCHQELKRYLQVLEGTFLQGNVNYSYVPKNLPRTSLQAKLAEPVTVESTPLIEGPAVRQKRSLGRYIHDAVTAAAASGFVS